MTKRAHHPNAFTLLEMIVVIIIMGLMASMIVPRLGGTRDREFQLTVDKVSDVMLMFAHRVSTSNRPVGYRFDSHSKMFELLIKREHEDEFYWDNDPLTPPVTIPSWIESENVLLYTDGELTDTSQWPITAIPGESRPLIETVIHWDDHTVNISLPAHAMGPSVMMDGIGEPILIPIDLDAEGRGRDEW